MLLLCSITHLWVCVKLWYKLNNATSSGHMLCSESKTLASCTTHVPPSPFPPFQVICRQKITSQPHGLWRLKGTWGCCQDNKSSSWSWRCQEALLYNRGKVEIQSPLVGMKLLRLVWSTKHCLRKIIGQARRKSGDLTFRLLLRFWLVQFVWSAVTNRKLPVWFVAHALT